MIFKSAHFNEFVVKCPIDPKKINKKLLQRNIQGGLILKDQYPELKNCVLFSVSEIHTDEQIDTLVSALMEVSNV